VLEVNNVFTESGVTGDGVFGVLESNPVILALLLLGFGTYLHFLKYLPADLLGGVDIAYSKVEAAVDEQRVPPVVALTQLHEIARVQLQDRVHTVQLGLEFTPE